MAATASCVKANGPHRAIQTGVGRVEVRRATVRDRGAVREWITARVGKTRWAARRSAPSRRRRGMGRSRGQRNPGGLLAGSAASPSAHAVDAEVLREDPLNLDLQFGVPLRTGRTLAD